MPAKKKAARPVTKTGRPRARKGVKVKPTELGAQQLLLASDQLEPQAAALAAQVAADGGQVLAAYREPLGGHTQLFVALPIDKVEPTAFQRDVSDGHVRRLSLAMDKTRRYLDPIIAVYEQGSYLTPNGGHRLATMKELGAKAIPALLVTEARVAYQILALNIEKAHNLREKATEVARMYRELVKLDPGQTEASYSLEFEEPQLATLGFAYEQRGRLSGGAYQPFLKKVDGFLDSTLARAVVERERRAGVLLAFDEAVTEAVDKLKAKGLTSPYLRAFVVARVNPLRFIKGDLPSFDDLLAGMTRRARGLNPDKINPADVARSGGGAPDTADD
jgi:ParB family chromosome partitioning protein